jgi:multimeric flavodoxin WrbA
MTTAATSKPDILYLSGSPRAHTCEALVALIEHGAKAAGARAQHFSLAHKRIAPCTGCGSCNTTGSCVLANKTSHNHLIDDYLELHALIERADALVVVAPLYFAGPPAQLKALYDRLQPYWAKRYVLQETPRPKRPAQLFIVGSGGDAHGHAPLVGITKSALAVAGFNLEKIHSFVGFKAKENIPLMPPEDKREGIALGELAHLRRSVAAQASFEQRAQDAGGAFARYLNKIGERKVLEAELRQVEAEIEAFKAPVLEAERAENVDVEGAYEVLREGIADARIAAKADEGADAEPSAEPQTELVQSTGTLAETEPRTTQADEQHDAKAHAEAATESEKSDTKKRLKIRKKRG